MKTKTQRAFTLVELLITVTILMILSLFVFLSVGGAQKRTRDERRITDANNIANAMDQYSSSNFRKYPSATNCYGTYCGENFVAGREPAAGLNSYINPFPLDPLNSGQFFGNYKYITEPVAAGQQPRRAAVVVRSFENDANRKRCNLPSSSAPDYVTAFYNAVAGDKPCYYVAR